MIIKVKVITKSKTEVIEKLPDNYYKIKFNTPREKGYANIKLIDMLSEYFDISKSKIKIVSGSKSTNKTVLLEDL